MEKEKGPKYTKEQLETQQSFATNEYLKNLALSEQIESNWKQYGQLGQQAGSILYETTVEHAPDDVAWKGLRQTGSSLQKEALRQNAAKLWQGSLTFLKTEDILSEMGYEGPNKYSGKYIYELGQEAIQQILGTYMHVESNKEVAKSINIGNKEIVKGLEAVLGAEKKKD